MALSTKRTMKLIERQVAKRTPVGEGMAAVLESCRKQAPSSTIWEGAAALEFEADAAAFERFVRSELRRAPDGVRGFYIGLGHYDRSPTVRPYVVGSTVPFDPEEPLGWTQTGEWWNSDGRAWSSKVIGRIMRASEAEPDEDLSIDGHYVLINAYIGLSLGRMIVNLPAELWCGVQTSRPVAYGFPGGDTFLAGLVERAG